MLFRINGINAMSCSILGGKQVIKFAKTFYSSSFGKIHIIIICYEDI